MALPHVTGVGTGRDEDSGEDVIVVFVTHKVPLDRLRPEDVVPSEVEGLSVRVLAMADDGDDDEPGSGSGSEPEPETGTA
ncbi:hypothetical protein [Streptomyces fructofermentans]|uniref:Uncharacterized protein n=1 Tax=Streptomyces fructofermentans TaxID=152141 RepID=A0A918NKG5_9ACTN|nr:hypothetical protein [Streptomyces fructofermentans]GGX74938.1 hypothetical protein GCM10010515_48110 [Streptomyces fructofermentans]